jgi:hypothetical protein
MAFKTGSIVLGTTRVINGIVPLRGFYTVELLSTNLSGNTTWNLKISAGGTNFDNAKEGGVDITETLVDDVAMVRVYQGNPGDKFRITFEGSTTGTVNYVLNV